MAWSEDQLNHQHWTERERVWREERQGKGQYPTLEIPARQPIKLEKNYIRHIDEAVAAYKNEIASLEAVGSMAEAKKYRREMRSLLRDCIRNLDEAGEREAAQRFRKEHSQFGAGLNFFELLFSS